MTEPHRRAFSERDFYLEEFRGRSLAIAVPREQAVDSLSVQGVLDALAANRTRVIVVSSSRMLLEKWSGGADVVQARGAEDGWVGPLWRGLGSAWRIGLEAPAESELAEICRRLALRLRLAKLVWIAENDPLERSDTAGSSYIDLPALDRILEAHDTPLLSEIRTLLRAGFPAVNVCRAEGLDQELFTYQGSGTLFTRERYTQVRRLGLDDLDAAHDLISRGVAEGFLVERSPDQLEAVLSHAFGLFVEERFLAGIGALIPHPAEAAGEIASLYTLTRFMGEGVGSHLVRFALSSAREDGLDYVFASTTSNAVQRFFERNGFRSAHHDEVPASKWEGYDEERKQRARCLLFEL